MPSLQPRHSTCIFVSVSDTEKRVRVLECGADCDSSEGSAICPDYFHFPLKPAQLISVGGEWGESVSERERERERPNIFRASTCLVMYE